MASEIKLSIHDLANGEQLLFQIGPGRSGQLFALINEIITAFTAILVSEV